MAAMVEVNALQVRYGRIEAVRGISFAIPRGEVFGFIGPNGAGKTSTIRVLATLLKPSAGQVAIAGLSTQVDAMAIRRRIGYMPDTAGVYPDLTVEEFLHYFGAAYGLLGQQRNSAVDQVLTWANLQEKKGAIVDTLSHGMKQRLSLARAVLHDPEVLLLDEPAGGLDPRARVEMRQMLRELQQRGKTILISSHILHELALLCTRMGIMDHGKLVAEGPLETIYQTLGLRRSVHVQLAAPVEGLWQQVRALPGIEGVEGVEHDLDRVCVFVDEQRLPVEELLVRIQSLGGQVRMFQPQAMDMETAFLKLTQGART